MKNKSPYIKSFDFLKTISIMMIVVTHLPFSPITRKNLLFPYWIDMAVPIFFIISGYVYSLSADNRQIDKIGDWFRRNNFIDKFTRIFVPYILIFLVEILLFKILGREVSLKEILTVFCTGGWGPGSYYFIVLLQLLFLFPFIFFITKKKCGWILLILFQIFLEIVTQKLGLPDYYYRLLFFRYLGFVTLGSTLYLHNKKGDRAIISKVINNKVLLILLFILGVGVVYLLNYSLYQTYIFKRWITTSLPISLYCFPLVLFFMKIESFLYVIPRILDNILTTIAKSTYHIFLVQMTYYWFRIGNEGRLRFEMIVSFLVCIPLGILFYYIENNITTKLFKSK